jgi:hypothetical protein
MRGFLWSLEVFEGYIMKQNHTARETQLGLLSSIRQMHCPFWYLLQVIQILMTSMSDPDWAEPASACTSTHTRDWDIFLIPRHWDPTLPSRYPGKKATLWGNTNAQISLQLHRPAKKQIKRQLKVQSLNATK